MRQLYWLTNEQVERSKPFFPKSHGKPRVGDRGIFASDDGGADLRRPRAEEGADLRDLSEGAPHGFEPPGGKGGADDQHECLIGFPPKLKDHDYQ